MAENPDEAVVPDARWERCFSIRCGGVDQRMCDEGAIDHLHFPIIRERMHRRAISKAAKSHGEDECWRSAKAAAPAVLFAPPLPRLHSSSSFLLQITSRANTSPAIRKASATTQKAAAPWTIVSENRIAAKQEPMGSTEKWDKRKETEGLELTEGNWGQ